MAVFLSQILYLAIIFSCVIFISSSSLSVLKISRRCWLVRSSVSLAVSAVPASISLAVSVVAQNPILWMKSVPANRMCSACQKWRTLRLSILSSISFGSVIVWYLSFGPIVGIGTSMMERLPPRCFFAGSLEKMALVGSSAPTPHGFPENKPKTHVV